MRKTLWTLGIACVFCLQPAVAQAQKLVYLVRHAERADDGMAAELQQADPALSNAGEQRAERLAVMLGGARIVAVYATEYMRTRDTGQPLASRLGLAVLESSARNPGSLVARLRAEHSDDIVLIIGHSNTVPEIIKAFGGPDVSIAGDEYENLFVLVPASGALSRIRY